jgi:hypothetical protein
MGVVIFTNDDEQFLVGKYVLMVGSIDTPPSDPDTTYILRTNRFTEKDVEAWLPYITNRLVVTIDKPPKITKKTEDNVVIDTAYKKRNDRTLLTSVEAMLSWTDRKRVWHLIQDLPIPYALAFLRTNRDDIDLWRLIAKANMEMDDDYVRAIFAYAVKENRGKTQWPKKKKEEDIAPAPFRQNDIYWKEILQTIKSVANEVRSTSSQLPKGMRKTKEAVDKWV